MSNIKKNNTVYFCIDEPNIPYKGVRGKGDVKIHEDIDYNVPIAEKIITKYLGDLEHPVAKLLLSHIKNGDSAILEITPDYFSTWDNSKR
jgi:S-ribosylhomocysteine lyase LuxS involved in autoinducer biosynthesis